MIFPTLRELATNAVHLQLPIKRQLKKMALAEVNAFIRKRIVRICNISITKELLITNHIVTEKQGSYEQQ